MCTELRFGHRLGSVRRAQPPPTARALELGRRAPSHAPPRDEHDVGRKRGRRDGPVVPKTSSCRPRAGERAVATSRRLEIFASPAEAVGGSGKSLAAAEIEPGSSTTSAKQRVAAATLGMKLRNSETEVRSRGVGGYSAVASGLNACTGRFGAAR